VLGAQADGETSLASAAERFGTPCYVYDLDAVGVQTQKLRAALGERFTLAYAVKANPSLAVLATLSRLGLSADVAQRGELAAALAAGFPAEHILATGPSRRTDSALWPRRVCRSTPRGPSELERLDMLGRELAEDPGGLS
jgi:diaminopimelate decarboxylase